MIPTTDEDFDEELVEEEETSKTYSMQLKKNIIYGYVDGLDAMQQAIYKILNTERYKYPIYSWDYGLDTSDLFGKNHSYVIPELKRRITEALVNDSRIDSVDGFVFARNKNTIFCTFSVHTTYGTTEGRKEVNI